MRKLHFVILVMLLIGFIASPVYSTTSLLKRRGPSEDKDEKLVRTSKSATLQKAEQAFIKGDYEKVVIIGNTYITQRTKSDDELQYLMGIALLKLNRFDEARNCFARVINDSRNEELLDEAYIGLADSYYLEGDYKKAKEHYEKVMQYFPDSDNISIVYYRLGECCSKLGESFLSKEYLNKISKFYPDSLEAKLITGEKSGFVVYTIQVGSFKNLSNAKKLCYELKQKGFDAHIYTATVENERFYRVKVGQYSSPSDAEDIARILRNKGYSAKICP